MKAVKDEITNLMEEAEQLSDVKEDLFNVKSDLNIKAVGMLLQQLVKTNDELTEISANKEYYDKDLCKTLNETVSQLVSAFSKIKAPTVTVNPNISVDLKPLQSSIDNVASTNKTLIDLISKISNGDKSNELYKLIISMVNQNNSFTGKAVEQISYKEDMAKLIEAINNSRPVVEKLKIVKDGYTTEIVPVYKK